MTSKSGWFRAVVLTAAVGCFLAGSGPVAAQPARAAKAAAPAFGPVAPKLVVVLVVDQMRGDYIDRYGSMWTKGLHRLVTQGAWYRRAAYPYATTVTCAGHATISTGAFPTTHGIISNSWLDTSTWKSVACADQPTSPVISYGLPVGGGYGPDRLLAPTFTDELRAQSPIPPRVVTMSLKPRTAIMLAGHKADAATWYSSAARSLVTSSFYTDKPVPFVADFVRANPIDKDFATPWTLSLPAEQYRFVDDGIGEMPPAPWTKTFPHAFTGGASERVPYGLWESSPRSDAYLGKLAQAAVDAMKLGQGKGTDYLGISFTALDAVGHAFGPESFEVQDILAGLDTTIGALLAHLDKTVGPANYVVALTGDHGVALIPESTKAQGIDAGRLPPASVVKVVQDELQQAFGPADYKIRVSGSDLYLEPDVVTKIAGRPGLSDRIVTAIKAVPGVASAYAATSLLQAVAAGDRVARAAWLSYRPERSGQFMVYPKPHWMFGADEAGGGTGHSLPYGYDQRVPVVLFGAGIKPGEYLGDASPADIAPTMALLSGITMSEADGKALIDAMAPQARPAAKR